MPVPPSLPTWQVPGYLETRDGHLTVDGVDALQLAQQHGTPLYVFSETRIADNIRKLRTAVESVHSRVKICYASKANSSMAVLDAVRRAGGDIEVNSGGELFKARKIGFRPDQIVFNGVSKTDAEIHDAIEYGILAINIDSLHELEQVRGIARSIGKRAVIPAPPARRRARCEQQTAAPVRCTAEPFTTRINDPVISARCAARAILQWRRWLRFSRITVC